MSAQADVEPVVRALWLWVPKTALSHFRWWRFVASAEEDAVACSLNYGDNAAVQEAVQPPRRTAIMSGKSSLAGP